MILIGVEKVFKISFIKRLKQLLCKHNYFPILVGKGEYEYNKREVIAYECHHCKHVQIK